MFKRHIAKATLLCLSLLGLTITTGCSNMSLNPWYTDPNDKVGVAYEYHAANGRVYYQAADGRYYYMGKDGQYHYQVYKYTRDGHRYYKHYRDSNNFYITNSGLSTQVRATLLHDPLLDGSPITVRTYKGTVRLDGVVDSERQRARAVEDALAVPGVRYVDDNLVVRSSRDYWF